MRIFKTRWFGKWARKQGVHDGRLVCAIKEMEDGLIDVDLGAHVFKKRISLPGRGKSGGVRVLVVYRPKIKAFFVYGFSKNMKDNVDSKELKTLKLLAIELLNYEEVEIIKGIRTRELIEVTYET